jgi:protein O-mannosyl-transferase
VSLLESSARTSGRHYLLAGISLVAVTLMAFSNSFGTGFALDNRMLLLSDPRIQDASAANVSLILRHTYWWPNGEAGIYRPLTSLTYLFNYAILGNGNRAAGYHWINFLLHATNVLLVFVLALRLLAHRTRAFRLAFFIALLWAVHPLLTESVTNIAGRADLLAGMAILGGYLIYLKSAEASGRSRTLWLAGLAGTTAAGAFCKESALVLPGVIVLHELACGKSGRMRRAAAGCAATLAPIGVMLWLRAGVLAASPPAEFPFVDNPIAGAGLWIGRLTAVKVLAHYLWLAFWPVKLSSDYSYSQIQLVRGTPQDWIAWATVAATLIAIAFLWRRDRLAFLFACFAFLNLLPTSNLLFPIGTIMAERFLYLPVLGLIAAIVVATDRVGPAPLAVVCLIAGAFTVRTWMRNLDWTDDLTMAEATVVTSPGSFKAHQLLAASLFQSDPTHGNIDRVLAEADKSVAILGALPDEWDVPGPWNLAATVHLAKGDALPPPGGRPQFEASVRLALRSIAVDAASRAAYDRRHGIRGAVPPNAADGYRILASAYLRLGKAAQALPAAIEARKIDPANVDVYGEIADAWLAQHRGEEAAVALAEGMFATGGPGLREDLLKLYQSGVDAKGCAVYSGPRGPALNPSCEIVHRDLCEAAVRANRPDLGGQLNCPNKDTR